jgi:hypothetical protein
LQRHLTEKVDAWQRVRPDWFQDGWSEMMDDADSARKTMLSDRAAGEREFQRLLVAYPDEGDLYFMRGRAYEAIGEKGLATDDYRRAEGLLPPGDLVTEGIRRALARVEAGN